MLFCSELVLPFASCLLSKLLQRIRSNSFYPMGFPGGASGKESACQSRRRKRHRFHPWIGKILSRRTWQPTPVFLPGESHGQRRLVGYSPWGCKESDMTEDLARTHALYPTNLCKTRNAALKTKSTYPLKQSHSPVQKQEELGCSLSDTKGLNAHATTWFLICFFPTKKETKRITAFSLEYFPFPLGTFNLREKVYRNSCQAMSSIILWQPMVSGGIPREGAKGFFFSSLSGIIGRDLGEQTVVRILTFSCLLPALPGTPLQALASTRVWQGFPLIFILVSLGCWREHCSSLPENPSETR